MKKINSYNLIHIGLLIRYLQSLDDNDLVKTVLRHINVLQDDLDNSKLEVSLSGLMSIPAIQEIWDEIKQMNPDGRISADLASRFKSEIRKFEHIVFSESLIKMIYTIPQRRFNGNYLADHPDKLLKKEIFNKITATAKFDFSASCRCILYGEGTAAAFHILRATEDTLRQYYLKYIKQNRLKILLWGPMTDQLRNKKSNKPDQLILNSLDLVRKSYRNPTQHPDSIYDIDSAQDLFGVCVDLINKMVNVLD